MIPTNLETEAEAEADSYWSTMSETSSMATATSPNYMKTTTCSIAKKESLQKSTKTLTKRYSFKPARNLTRMGSKKVRMRRTSLGTDLKNRLNKSRSIKLANQPSIVLPGDAKASSDERNGHVQASPPNSEFHLNADFETSRSLSNSNQNFASSGYKPIRLVMRSSSLRPVRVLKTKRTPVNRSSIPDSGIHKATCSSALKGSIVPNHLELQPGGSESEGVSTVKVCPYSYCSLHGGRHSDLPPLKRFVSMRRRFLKTQKSKKFERVSSRRGKRSTNSKKVTQMNLEAGDGDPGDGDPGIPEAGNDRRRAISSTRKMGTPKSALKGEGFLLGDDEGIRSAVLVAENEIMVGKASELRLHLKESTHECGESCSTEMRSKVSCPALKETITERSSIRAVEKSNKLQPLEDSVQDKQIITVDYKSDSATDVADKAEKEKQKHRGLWNLIYQQVVSETAGEEETGTPLDKAHAQEREDDPISLPGVNRSTSCSDLSDMSTEDQIDGNRNVQLHHHDAVKLIQEAFDQILSEIPDHSSDDQSTNGDTYSDKKLIEKNNGEERELSTSTSFESGSNITEQDEGEIRFEADNNKATPRERAESKVGNKSNQKSTKSWSNLKRVILLKRFVKALENVRELNLRKPRYLTVEAESEAERIRLRHQTTQQKKHSEEWMLDYALQQVISTLAPAQKRKVGLLVQAFETLGPVSDTGTSSPRSSAEASSPCATSGHTPTASSRQNGAREEKELIFGIILRKTSGVEKSFKGSRDQFRDIFSGEADIPTASSAPKETTMECGCAQAVPDPSSSKITAADLEEQVEALHGSGDNNFIVGGEQTNSVTCNLEGTADPRLSDKVSPKPADDQETSDQQFLMNRKSLTESLEKGSSIPVLEACDPGIVFDRKNMEPDNHSDKNSKLSDQFESQIRKILGEPIGKIDAVSSPSAFEQLEESNVKDEETKLENNSPQGCTVLEPESNSIPTEAEEKQKHKRLWFLIYKHMVSESAAQLEETEKEGQGDASSSTLIGEHNAESPQIYSAENQEINGENHHTQSRIQLQQIEAIRLVEEAIDEIPLPEIQDESPDNQSVIRKGTSSTAHLESKLEEKEARLISDSNACQDQSKAEETSEERDRPKLTAQKSWSNLKKVILLRRFIKAVEKVKKFNPQKPRFLPLTPEEEAEKVRLRHQDMLDRKHSDEWMLDYALQQVVAQLTPARKRKVALLVEAFETVAPTT